MIFDKTKFYLGEMCGKNHEWLSTKECLRYITNYKCVQCTKEYNVEYSRTHKKEKLLYDNLKKEKKRDYILNYNALDTTKKQKHLWYLANKDKIKTKKDTPEEKEKTRLYNKLWNEVHQDEVRKYNAQLEVKERKNRWIKNEYSKNISFRISSIIKTRLRKLLQIKKKQHWFIYLGWNLTDLILKFTQQQFSLWVRYQKKEKIEIDHIIPLKGWFRFNSVEDEDFKLYWNIRNLRLEEKRKNIIKSNKYAGSLDFPILTLKEFQALKKLFSIKLLCNVIWNEYELRDGNLN